jgi:hypothetical protein
LGSPDCEVVEKDAQTSSDEESEAEVVEEKEERGERRRVL